MSNSKRNSFTPRRTIKSKDGKSSKQNKSTHTVPRRNGYPLITTPNIGTLWFNSGVRGVADSVRTKLRYVLPFQTVLNAGSTVSSLKFTSNAYDVDAALGSTSMGYFSELAQIYARFRTLGMKYRFDVSTNETHSLAYVHGFMSQSLSSTGVGLNYAESPYVSVQLSGGINADPTKSFTGQVTVSQFFGTKQALVDDTFTGLTTSSTLPTSGTMFLYIGAVSTATLAAGFDVTGFIELDLMFYDRNSLVT
jgi:hypothetical protein